MPKLINIYCDESSHLENDRRSFMGLGALSCPNNRVRDFARAIRSLKRENAIPDKQELKWVSVSPTNIELYKAVLRLFFESDELRFRIIIADKRGLNHENFGHTHDEWYYKMYYNLLTRTLEQKNRYEIYLDIKDTLGSRRVRKLHRVLCNAMWDFDQAAILRIKQIRSHESALLQVADILIGAVCSVNCDISTSDAKRQLVKDVQESSGFSLARATSLGEQKFNVFHWTGTQV
ncbi:MAG: DUF3800 domain-containing protein [Candidatus Eremiobacteraeota bacterium]|nr:DUF3800 domain-containing protein [Candidatus Eremiobacteraeota bacterium]